MRCYAFNLVCAHPHYPLTRRDVVSLSCVPLMSFVLFPNNFSLKVLNVLKDDAELHFIARKCDKGNINLLVQQRPTYF